MKAMTCKRLGGPCDFIHHGQSADEVIKAQDRHLKEMVAKGDETHESALKEMKGRWKKPISGMGWYRKTKRDFSVSSRRVISIVDRPSQNASTYASCDKTRQWQNTMSPAVTTRKIAHSTPWKAQNRSAGW